MEIPAEDYKAEIVVRNGGYAGRCRIYVPHDEMTEFADTGVLRRPTGWYATTMDGTPLSEEYALTPNEFVVLMDSAHPDGATMLGRWSEEMCIRDRSKAIVAYCEKLGIHAEVKAGVAYICLLYTSSRRPCAGTGY